MNPPPPVALLLGIVVIIVAVYAVARKVDVRLALFPAALAMGALAGKPLVIVQTFFASFSDPKSVIPICCAMGFAYVLRQTECDQHLVQLLVKPLRRIRPLLIPGAVLVGFLVNIPITSQTGTAVAIGSVLVALLTAARISPLTTGSALLLGASIGGELINPGAPEYSTIANVTAKVTGAAYTSGEAVIHTLPLLRIQLIVSMLVFWALSLRAEARYQAEHKEAETEIADRSAGFKVNLIKAMIPILPLALLFLVAKPFGRIPLPAAALVDAKRDLADVREEAQAKKTTEIFDSRLIGAAMLVGVAAAALTVLWTAEDRTKLLGTGKAFFDGAGYAFKEVVALIVIASCFAKGVELLGIGEWIGHLVRKMPALLLPTSGLLPMALAFLSGSGIASTQGLFAFFATPAFGQGVDVGSVGSVVALGSAAGRTMSPVAAVNLMCGQLTGTQSTDLVRRVALPCLAGVIAAIILGRLTIPHHLPQTALPPTPVTAPAVSPATR